MNAVVLAAGLQEGGPAAAREKLEAFWRGVNAVGGRNIFGDIGAWSRAFDAPDWLKATPGWQMAQGFAAAFSPYDFNPLNLNPLHDVLEEQVNFAALRKSSPIALYVSATGVQSGKSRVFRTDELTGRHVMASACLPHLFQAVTIDGEAYWDGGYLANPALWPLFYDPTPADILIVNINPFSRPAAPRGAAAIVDRLNEIIFNASLVSELRAIAFVQKLIEDGLLTEDAQGRYRHMLIHAVDAGRWLGDLGMDSKFDTEWSFLAGLRDRGRAAADAWLKADLRHVGHRSSVDLKAQFL
jgi:NTE family protein